MFPPPPPPPPPSLNEIILENVNNSTGYIHYLNLMRGLLPPGMTEDEHLQYIASACVKVFHDEDRFKEWLLKGVASPVPYELSTKLQDLADKFAVEYDKVMRKMAMEVASGGGASGSTYTLRL
jgi:hypothetical protein